MSSDSSSSEIQIGRRSLSSDSDGRISGDSDGRITMSDSEGSMSLSDTED